MGKTAIIALIIVILAVAGGAVALTHKSSPKTSPPPVSTPATTSTTTKTPAPTSAQSSATITYTDNGFSPASLVIKSGGKLTIKNDSSGLLQFDSNPHPAHTDDPELNAELIDSGQSKTITVTTTGTFGYHNHLNADQGGTITVQ